MVKWLVRRLRRWQAAEAVLTRLTGRLTTWPAEDFGRFVSASAGTAASGSMAGMPPAMEPFRYPQPISTPPGTFETRFMRLHAEGRFDEMWEMLAEDAQRAWGGRESFIREMPRLDQWMEILELQVVSVKILPSWSDLVHQRTYNNVARLVMRYRVRQQWREWTFDREVHLIPATGGWRTLCYPMRSRTTSYSAGGAAAR